MSTALAHSVWLQAAKKHLQPHRPIMLNNKQRGLFNKPTRKQNPGFWKAVGLCGSESVILKHSFLKHVQHVPFPPIIHSLAACNLVSDHIYTHSHTPLRLLFKPRRCVCETDEDRKPEKDAFSSSPPPE